MVAEPHHIEPGPEFTGPREWQVVLAGRQCPATLEHPPAQYIVDGDTPLRGRDELRRFRREMNDVLRELD